MPSGRPLTCCLAPISTAVVLFEGSEASRKNLRRTVSDQILRQHVTSMSIVHNGGIDTYSATTLHSNVIAMQQPRVCGHTVP